jgi:hypothetical protein
MGFGKTPFYHRLRHLLSTQRRETAFLWMFIRTLRRVLKPGNSSLLGPVRMDNLLKAHN